MKASAERWQASRLASLSSMRPTRRGFVGRRRDGRTEEAANNLMAFLHKVAAKSGSVILGTATPIQLDAVELWDLMTALGQGAPQVLGSPFNGAEWWRETSIQYLSAVNVLGRKMTPDAGRCFAIHCPRLAEHAVFRDIRTTPQLPLKSGCWDPRFEELGSDIRSAF